MARPELAMLTRLKVNGFKNLRDVDVRFGPFTCIAGPNGAGKSNLFDAIAFLAALAEKPLVEAALSVRGGRGQAGDVRSLFHRSGSEMSDRMVFEVEMIIPALGVDQLGQLAKASMTYLTYRLELRYRSQAADRPLGGIEIVSESLDALDPTEAGNHLGFEHSEAWRDSVIGDHQQTRAFISTTSEGDGNVVLLHAEASDQTTGRPRNIPARSLPRTMLSSANNAAEHPTLVIARHEMTTWTQLQLEPTALRAPDSFTVPPLIGPDGAHVPALLRVLAHVAAQDHPGGDVDLYSRIANRLAELNENVRSIAVDIDEKRQLLSIVMTDGQGTQLSASSLSDGTLRFLALAVMEASIITRSLLCLEEPENGIHPRRIPAMLQLLRDLAVDTDEPAGKDNPLRQVIVNTHSPQVVAEVPHDSLLMAEAVTQWGAGERITRLRFAPLPDTWRGRVDPALQPVARGVLQDFLNPLGGDADAGGEQPSKRVKEREDLQMLLPFANRVTER
jgi:predicted ATPase